MTASTTPLKYMERNAPESSWAARRVTQLASGFLTKLCGMMISATRVGAPAGGRPRWTPSVPSGSASSSRNNVRMPFPVTARASPDISHP